MNVLAIIAGIFKFWDQVTWLVKTLQDTPAEKHQELTMRMQTEAEEMRKGARPKWDT